MTATPEYVERRLAERGLPTGGGTGEYLTKATDVDYEVAWAAAPSSSGGVTGYFHAGPTTNTNNGVWVDITGIGIQVAAGKAVWVSIRGEYSTSATTSGISLRWNVGAMTNRTSMRVSINYAAAGPDAFWETGATAGSSGPVSPSAVATSLFYPFAYEGFVYNTGASAGTFTPQFAPEVNTQTATVRTVVAIAYQVN